MTIKAAFDALAGLTISGVSNNYFSGTLPEVIAASGLPCKLTILRDTRQNAGEAQGFSVGLADFNVEVEVRLYRALMRAGTKATRANMLIQDIDRVAKMLDGNWTLSNKLIEPMRVLQISAGPHPWSGQQYLGVSFVIVLPVQIA